MPQTSRAALTVAALALLALPAKAQQVATPTETTAVDEKAFKMDAPGTYANADLSYVLTSGNSTSSTLGFRGDITHRWTKQSIGFATGGLSASSSPDTRYAVGTPGDFEVQVPPSEQTAENYYARGRYDYKLSTRLFYTLGAGWERNQFSGIQNRWVGDTGIGYILLSNDRTSFRSAAGHHLHEGGLHGRRRERQLVRGRAAGLGLPPRIFAGTTLIHTLIADENLEDTADLRVDAQFGLQVAMTKKLGLKVNWRLLWDNQPALAEYPLYTPGGVNTGLKVLAPYKELDQGFSVSLVFSFAPPKKG